MAWPTQSQNGIYSDFDFFRGGNFFNNCSFSGGVNMKFIVFLIPILLLSGCVSSAKTIGNDVVINVEGDEKSYIQAHQFWNEYPLGMGNTTTIDFNNSVDLFLDVSVYTNHNYSTTIIIDSLNMTHYTENFTTGQYFIHQRISGNYSAVNIHTMSYGHYNESEDSVGDFFIVRINSVEIA
jgi:hypothetical protein